MSTNQKDNSGIFTLAKQSSITLLGSVISKILRFSFLVLITRIVSPNTYGIYTLTLSVVLFAKSLADLSVHRGIDYFIPQLLQDGENDKARFVLFSAALISVSTTSIITLILWVNIPLVSKLLNEPELQSTLPILLLALPLLAFSDVVIRFFISIKDMRYHAYLKSILFPLSQIVFTLALLIIIPDVLALSVGYIIATSVMVASSAIIIMIRVKWVIGKIKYTFPISRILKYSFPLVFAGIIYATVGQIDFFLIGYFSTTGSTELGIYKISYLFSGNILIFLNSFAPVFKPMITETKGSIELFEARYSLASRWILILSLPVVISIFLLPRVYLEIFFTSQYAAGATALMILCFGYMLNILVGPEGMVLEGMGHTRFTLINTTMMVLSNTLVGILLIPRLGIDGAAIGTATGMGIAVSLGVAEIYYLYGVHPFTRRTFLVLGAATLSVIPSYLLIRVLGDNSILAIIVPVSICVPYIAALSMLNAFDSEDRMVAEAVDERLGIEVLGRIISE